MTWTPGIDTIGTVNAVARRRPDGQTSGIVEEHPLQGQPAGRAGRHSGPARRRDRARPTSRPPRPRRRSTSSRSTRASNCSEQRRRHRRPRSRRRRPPPRPRRRRSTSSRRVLDRRQLRAPFGGTIGIPRIDVGQYMTPGTIVATLQDLDTHARRLHRARAAASASSAIGQPVRFGVDVDDLPFTGSITGIDPKVDAVEPAGLGPRRDRQSRRQAHARASSCRSRSSCRPRTASSRCRRPRS